MLQGKSVISVDDLSKEDIESVLELAEHFETKGYLKHRLDGIVLGSLFFEGSTRTRLSFETAIQRIGGSVVGFAGAAGTSYQKKGESFEDTIRMVDGYVDLTVIRHPEVGSAKRAAQAAEHPVINAGDGANEHPTQTLIDLYAIKKTQGSLDNLTVAMVGDLKYGRVPHSLARALTHFPSTKQLWVAPESLKMPSEVTKRVKEAGVEVTETETLQEAVEQADILYMTRVQAERFKDAAEYDAVKDVYILSSAILKKTKPTMRILHALPRRYEIPEEIDTLPHAYYFEQAKGGVPVRASLLTHILGQVKR